MTEYVIEVGDTARVNAVWQHGPASKVRIQSIDGENYTLSSLDVEFGAMPTLQDAYDFSHLSIGEEVKLYLNCQSPNEHLRCRVTSKMGGLAMVSTGCGGKWV